VARAVVSAGYELLELRALDLSLEEIFLELTRDEPSLPEIDGHIDEIADIKLNGGKDED